MSEWGEREILSRNTPALCLVTTLLFSFLFHSLPHYHPLPLLNSPYTRIAFSSLHVTLILDQPVTIFSLSPSFLLFSSGWAIFKMVMPSSPSTLSLSADSFTLKCQEIRKLPSKRCQSSQPTPGLISASPCLASVKLGYSSEFLLVFSGDRGIPVGS